MSIPRFELDKAQPIDPEKAISFFGSEDTFYRLLVQYEDVSLIQDLIILKKAVDDKDYEEVKERIHSIKGASAYAGAGRVTDH
jgi:HPt (histidine-containing phosphotransfer) domain-containing protein